MGVLRSLIVSFLMVVAPGGAGAEPPEAAIQTWLSAYDAALNSKDLARLERFYHPDVTIFEGGSTNHGWTDYRDNHLGPELKEFETLEFAHSNVHAYALGADGRAAYVTAEYRLKARMAGRDVDALGLETLVLVGDGSGGWRIRHSHTSSRRRPPSPQAAPSPRP